MRYGLIESGEIIKKGDEIYSPSLNQWFPIDSEAYRYHPCLFPVRRLLDQSKSVETFTIPYGPWIGCTGTVFMDGKHKKIRLQNVFVGGEQHVIDFPYMQRYDNKHFILEDDEILVEGDKFVSYFNDINDCQITLGMTVQAAKKKHTAIKLLVRPIS
jgi:hypothetical protein